MTSILRSSKTRATLLARLRTIPDDSEAWTEFVAWYGPRIHAWCMSWGLPKAEAEDITRTVLLKLAGNLREFQYDPDRSFRTWLKTVTHHTWRDITDQQNRPEVTEEITAILPLLNQPEAGQSLAKSLEEAFDQELLELASARVRLRVEPQAWEAYRLLAIEGQAGADAARALGMKVAAVFVARGKVHQMLKDEVARLEGSFIDPA